LTAFSVWNERLLMRIPAVLSVEKLMRAPSFDKAIEVQTEFARQAYANFVAESQKICELYSELAKQIFRPWEGFAATVTQAAR
jgi:hypothetical protein